MQKRRSWDILITRHNTDRFVFRDETGASTKMTRLYGWGPRSERVVSDVPFGHWQATTFIGELRATGLTAPTVIDWAMNGEIFLGYLEQQLIPTLNGNEFAVMDNLSSHKMAGVCELLESAECTLLYFPPYSPDLNPIERAFSKLKTLMRKHAERTVDALWDRIGSLVEKSTPEECRNYFKHCGYI